MALAMFASLGLLVIIDNLNSSQVIKNLIFAIIACAIVVSGLIASDSITSYQVNTPSAHNSVPIGDQKAIYWISENVLPNSSLVSFDQRSLWIRALTNISNISDNKHFFDADSLNDYFLTNPDYIIPSYVYYQDLDSELYKIPSDITNYYSLVFDIDGAKIYKRK